MKNFRVLYIMDLFFPQLEQAGLIQDIGHLLK